MPTNYFKRLLLIGVVLWISLSAIYPQVPGSIFWIFKPSEPISFEPNLKRGIDMAGGTALVYEIQGSSNDPELAERVLAALKKRVDPQGVRGLIWRPQGANRIEIQMPASGKSAKGEATRQRYQEAKQSLEGTNLRMPAVLDDIENLSGEELGKKINSYASDSPRRKQLLDELVALTAKVKDARSRKDVKAAAEARTRIEEVQQQLNDTNLSVAQLEAVLDLKNDLRQPKLQELKGKFSDFPARLSAIERYESAYGEYAKIRNSLDDVADLKKKLRGSGVLSFNIVVEQNDPDYVTMIERLRTDGPRTLPGDRSKWFQVDRPDQFGHDAVPYNGQDYVLARIDREGSLMSGAGLPVWKLASATKGRDERGRPAVNFEFDNAGGYYFGQLTDRFKAVGGRSYRMAMILDNKVISAPSLPKNAIYDRGEITGDFSESDTGYIASTLSAGALPAQLTNEPIREITVGPQLGNDNLRAGFISCLAGLVIVAIFLIGYYYLSGLIAFIAVLVNLIVILGAMALLGATFTLPGVAGIVLSVAMAVDANVLIFERLREEQSRGLSLRVALNNSYDRAFSAIFDGQLTTAISSIFLYWFGSEEVRGFGLTLLIGIVTSLFTALYVTKTIFGILVDRFGLKDLNSLPRMFPRWNQLLTPRVNWVRLSWAFSLFSVAFIGVGLILFGVKLFGGEALDTELSGGTKVRIKLVEPTDRETVQSMVSNISENVPDKLAQPRVISVGTDRREYEISTPTIDMKGVQSALIDNIGNKLVVRRPSDFENVDLPIDDAFNQSVFPIDSAATRIDGVPTYLVQNHVNGVAVVLKNLDPPMSQEELQARVVNRAYREGNEQRAENVEVAVSNGGRQGVVVMSDSRYAYDPSNSNTLTAWRANLAAPAWSVVVDAVHNPPQLENVTKFDPQVADEAKWNTGMALVLSFLGIMVYIWLRFGDLRFGWATIVACIHDALFVIAAVGYSYYLGQIDFLDTALLIRPFRVDLTLIAAVLTVVGYSMNDTVVVFDRIRENRGKYGVLSSQVVNDSINQTFSRTVLTGGTSIGILLVMYVIGGEGIHGFTFVMLLGIIAGTYSSVGIASPLLLLGGRKSDAVSTRSVRPGIVGG